jgi:hypothetical protein
MLERNQDMETQMRYSFLLRGLTAGEQPGGRGCKTVFARMNLVKRMLNVHTKLKTEALALACAIALLTSQINGLDCRRWSKMGLPGPAGQIAIVRSFIRLDTAAFVFLDTSPGTAFLGYNNPSSGQQEDIELYRWMWAMRVWMATFILKPQNITVVSDFAFKGIRAGLDMRFFTRKEEFQPGTGDRFNLDRMRGSNFAFIVGHVSQQEWISDIDPMPLFGSYKAADISANVQGVAEIYDNKGLKWPGWAYYYFYWDFDRINSGRTPPTPVTSYDKLRKSTWVKGICPMNVVVEYDPVVGWKKVTPNTGYFPQVPGARATLMGQQSFKMALGDNQLGPV